MADEWYVDYSDGQRTGVEVANTNVARPGETPAYPTGVIRYVTAPNLRNPPPPSLPKHITPAEYASFKARGLKIRYFYQGSTRDPDGGYAAGVANAQKAKAGLDELGSTEVVFFCNDRTDLPSVANWRAYLRGAASVLGANRVGAYGFRNAIDAAQGYAAAFVQAGRRSELHPTANYWQDNNFQPTSGSKTYDRLLVIKDYTAETPLSPTGNKKEASMLTLPASPQDTTVVLPLPGVPCRIVIAPAVDIEGKFIEVFTRGIWLLAGYKDSEGKPTNLGQLMPEVVDGDGVGHIQSPAYLAGHGDALGGVFTYSSASPFTVAVYEI